jgi:hypothetical protein
LHSLVRQRIFALDAAAGAPYLGVTIVAALLAGCGLADRYLDGPVRRMLTRRLR